MFELPTLLLSIVSEMANNCTTILMKKGDDGSNRGISHHKGVDLGVSTLSSDISEDDLDHT